MIDSNRKATDEQTDTQGLNSSLQSVKDHNTIQSEKMHRNKKPSGNKRKHLKRWLQNLKEHSSPIAPEDEETILIDIEDACLNCKYCLTFIPVFPSPEIKPPLSNEIRDRKHHVHRLKEFLRGHLRRKLEKLDHISINERQLMSTNAQEITCRSQFRENTQRLKTLFDDVDHLPQGNDQNPHTSIRDSPRNFSTQLETDSLAVKSTALFDGKAAVEPSSISSLKRPSDVESCSDTDSKRACTTKGIEDSFDHSSKYSNETSYEESIIKTPSILLTKASEADCETPAICSTPNDEKEKSLPTKKLSVALEVANFVSKAIASTKQEEKPDKPTVRPGINSNNYEPKQILIPTFRPMKGNMDVSEILENVTNGTMNDSDLIKLARKEEKPMTFRDKGFYDLEHDTCTDQSASTSEEHERTHTNSVKFEKFSCLFVYDASKHCNTNNKFDTPKGLKINSRQAVNPRSKYTGDGENDATKLCKKPILKSKNNERAELESMRAGNCDRVDVFSFLKIFEHHEARRRREEVGLGTIREQQLSQYYSNHSLLSSSKGRKGWPTINEDIGRDTSECKRDRKFQSVEDKRTDGRYFEHPEVNAGFRMSL